MGGYIEVVRSIHQDFFVFIDEMGLHYNLTRPYGRAAPGQRVRGHVPFKGGGRMTLLGALGSSGPLTEIAFEGYLNTEIFRLYVRDFLAPKLYRDQIVVMDNLAIHRDRHARELIEQTGASVLMLPPHMPELNPIEECWSKLKQLIRSEEPRNFEEGVDAIAKALDAVTEFDAAGWFGHCGYPNLALN